MVSIVSWDLFSPSSTSKENVENGRREYVEVGGRKGGEEKEYVRREGKKSDVDALSYLSLLV